MIKNDKKSVAIIVAHPDDETLWAGGTIISHPACDWFIVSLCRRNDENRSSRFFNALKTLKAKGTIGDLDDGPEQKLLELKEIENAILTLLDKRHFDVIISHNPTGEYTRHIRHEQTGQAVINLWHTNRIAANQYWAFAYEDGNKKYLPKYNANATICNTLIKRIWERKYKIITEIYGFDKDSWEAKTTPKTEAFWQFSKPIDAFKWMKVLKKK